MDVILGSLSDACCTLLAFILVTVTIITMLINTNYEGEAIHYNAPYVISYEKKYIP